MYSIGTGREKWTQPQANAQVGDTVLIREKNLSRLEWSTGTIIEVHPSADGLVRRVTLQPHKRKGKATTETPRQRAIHYLVLIKRMVYKDHPSVVNTRDISNAELQQVRVWS